MAVAGTLAGCGPGAQNKDKPLVGFIQVASTISLDAIRDGFVEQLAEEGFKDGENMTLELANANGDVPTLGTLVDGFVQDDAALIVANSTQATQAVLARAQGKPVVFCGVMDPVAAGAASEPGRAKPGVTGVANPFDPAKGVELALRFMPAAKKLGTLYDPSEAFAEKLLAQFRQACRAKGVEPIAVAVAATTEVPTGMQSLKAKGAQAVVQLPSNTINQGIDAQVNQARQLKLPVFSLQTDQVPRGVVAAMGPEFKQAGRDAGKLAAELLRGKTPEALPMTNTRDDQVAVNHDEAKRFGLTVPEGLSSANP